MTAKSVGLFLSLLSSGLMAGLFFAWAVSVLPGLARVGDHTFVSTMQSINRAIVNPAFVIPFLITPVVLIGAAVVQFRAGDQRKGWLLLGAAATYAVGVLGVTFGGNVPLNNELDRFDLSSAESVALVAQRTAYETVWNRWHYGRTIASIATFAIVAGAALSAADLD